MKCVLLFVMFAAWAFGQSTTATLFGTVTDPSGAALPQARVTVRSAERGDVRTVEAGAAGNYVVDLLPVGRYTVEVRMPSFKDFRREGITLNAEQNVRVDVQMEIGSVNEVVSVSGDAPQVDSRSAELGATLDTRRVDDLPINGRNVVSLAALLPGVSSVSAPQTFTNDRNGPTFTTSGSRANQNYFLLDGGNFNSLFRNTGLNYPPPDALEEVHILTSNYTAEFGRNGGTVLNVVTKSGTNSFHGDVWEYLRNSDLNARSFFAISVPKQTNNQFGGTLGGPLKKNRLFFFAAYEGLRNRQYTVSSNDVPLTANERNGIFTSNIKDPLTGKSFPNAIIPVSRIDPVAATILSKFIPFANTPTGQYVVNVPAPQNNDDGLIRVDATFNRHTIDARYFANEAFSQAVSGDLPSYEQTAVNALDQSASAGDTFTISPTVLSQARIAVNRFANHTTVLNPYSLADLGGNFPRFGPPTPPAITVTGRMTLGNTSAAPSRVVSQSMQADENLSIARGKHSLKAGAEYLRLYYVNRSYFQTQGGFSFSGQITGNAAADFLLGKAQTLSVGSPVLEQDGVQNNGFFYFQDDWRVTKRLTLNLGLRYELALPWFGPHNLWGTFVPGQQSTVYPNAPRDLVYPGDAGIPRGLVGTDWNNVAPRFGFAWDVLGTGRTAVRGGYGIYYDQLDANLIQNTGQPFRYAYTITAPYSLSNPLLGGPAIPTTVNLTNPTFVAPYQIIYPDPNLRTPYLQQFNLDVQQQVWNDLLVDVGYVGRIGHKLLIGLDSNPAIYGPGATLNNENARRIYQGFGQNNILSTIGNSDYNGLQIGITKRYAHGFTLQGSYTFSRSVDNSSSYTETAAVPDVFNLHTQWALSDFSAKHIASASWVWDLPKLNANGGAMRAIAAAVAGGWTYTGSFTYNSGLPVNVTSGSDVALTGTENQRPNVVGSPDLPGGRSRAAQITEWFNTAAFAAAATGSFGNAGRNVITGPPQKGFNMALMKNFPIPLREGMRLQFRAEAFSVFNVPNFSSPNATLTSKTFGQITSAGGDRQLQFALKLLF